MGDSVSHKYRTFNQLLEDVSIDFRTYALEGMIEPQQLIKVATRVNYDLGLKIHRTKEEVIDVDHFKSKLPDDFAYLNYAWVCGEYKVSNTPPSGTHVDTTHKQYVPNPDGGDIGPCDDPTCKDVCTVQKCDNQDGYMVIQYTGGEQYRTFTEFFPLRIKHNNSVVCDCPNLSVQSADIAQVKDGYLLTNFECGKIYLSYQGAMEDTEGNLLVLDHPYCNEYYEYALKQRILENMLFNGEQVSQQLGLIEQKLRAARNTALGFVNTGNFKDFQKIWETNRKAQYHNYYNMFKSHPTLR
tara:strand:- start:9857 stop:10750 length:894 start_codon:yes stop_codon:yes gene_type:complete